MSLNRKSRNSREKPIKVGNDFSSVPSGVRDLKRNFADKNGVERRLEEHIVKGKAFMHRRESIIYRKEIEERRKEMSDVVKSKNITKEQVVEEISKIAFSSTTFIGENIKIGASDKLKALDMLSKWLGLYERDNAQKASQNALLQVAFVGNDALPNEVKATLERESLLKDSIWSDESMPKLESKTMDKLRGKSK